MNRLTINLSEGRCKALKDTSARRGQTIGQLIDQSLGFYGINTRDDATELVQLARRDAGLSAAAAARLAVTEARATRRG